MTHLYLFSLLRASKVLGITIHYNKLDNRIEIQVKNSEDLWYILYYLKNNHFYDQLIDIRTVHYPKQKKPFKLIYILLSIENNIRIKIITISQQKLRSVTSLEPRAEWIEREIWDIFGILFFKNKKPRIKNRLLTDYGFKGHPILKDFPERGTTEVIYDESSKRVITVKKTISINRKAK